MAGVEALLRESQPGPPSDSRSDDDVLNEMGLELEMIKHEMEEDWP
jgi:hypothetical protein